MSIESFSLRRAELEARIEDLISLLDILDGDIDLEPDEDGEPSLGAPEQIPQHHWYAAVGIEEDREREDEIDEDGGDTEPNGDELDYSGCEDDHWRFL